jgi:glycosyltransferase involved in cell wall biosynthesis
MTHEPAPQQSAPHEPAPDEPVSHQPTPDLPIEAMLVVVPVRNEEALLPRCLSGLRDAITTLAAAHPEVRTQVVLVLDSCTDASVEIARASGFPVVEIASRNVGYARAYGVAAALSTQSAPAQSTPPPQTWIANTDADSVVPHNWLTHQLELANRGAQLMIGTVRPDIADLDPDRVSAWLATHVPGTANGHTHGANLGIRADAYAQLGGFESAPEHEDVALVERARRAGLDIVASDECWVLTSGRTHGRTPGGYARYIRDDLGARPSVVRNLEVVERLVER